VQVKVTVENPRDLYRVAQLYPKELAELWACSPALVYKKMAGKIPWFKREVEIFHKALTDRGVVIALGTLIKLFEPGQIVDRPLWTKRSASITGDAGR
jgi:hypothetical protein